MYSLAYTEERVGEVPELCQIRYQKWIRQRPDLPALVDEACQLILNHCLIQKRTTRRPAKKQSAMDYLLEAGLREWELYDAMRIALYQARTDPRYFGVRDILKERYCSSCRRALPIGRFDPISYTCRRCKETGAPR